MATLLKVSRFAVALFAVSLVACDAEPTTAPALSLQFSSNASNAHACQDGGFASLQRADGTRFKNAGDCTSYAAKGGTLMPVAVALPVITSFNFVEVVGCDHTQPFGYIFVAVFSGGAGTVDHGIGAVTSGVPFNGGTNTVLTLSVTNAGGTVTSTFSFGSGPIVGCSDDSGGF